MTQRIITSATEPRHVMVERVARKMAAHRWDGFDAEEREAARDLARAAIEAMRIPTTKMIAAGMANVGNGAPSAVWRDMCDEALR